MKYKALIVLLVVLQVILSCSGDAMPDCFKNAGDTVSYEVPVAEFTSLNVSESVEVIINEGTVTKVVIETGENFKDDISAITTDGILYLKNSGSCNWVRDYNMTKIYVTTPHLEKIYSASQFAVKSSGMLHFPVLLLQSGLFSDTSSGTFELTVDCQSLAIEDNQSAYYNINGNAATLSVNFYSGDARFEGSGLMAGDVTVFHRSSNDIIVNPQNSVTGTLYSTGNLVLKNTPATVNVNRLYSGDIIYQ